MRQRVRQIALLLGILLCGMGCSTGEDKAPAPQTTELTQDEKKRIGAYIDQNIAAHIQAPVAVLSPTAHTAIFQYLNQTLTPLQQSTFWNPEDVRTWKLRLILNNKTRSAFTAPDGYIYLSTGLLRWLPNQNALRVVLAFSMIESARDFVARKLTKKLGLSYLIDLSLGGRPQSEKALFDALQAPLAPKPAQKIQKQALDILCRENYPPEVLAQLINRSRQPGYNKAIEWIKHYHLNPSEVAKIHDFVKKNNCNTYSSLPDLQYLNFIQALP